VITITIPVTQVLSIIPKEIVFFLFFLISGMLIFYIGGRYMDNFVIACIGVLMFCSSFIFLFQFIIGVVITSMPTIPPQWTNITWPISFEVI